MQAFQFILILHPTEEEKKNGDGTYPSMNDINPYVNLQQNHETASYGS